MKTIHFDQFRLESGAVLSNVPVAYQTWGQLNAAADNAVVVCHALTGDTRADEWWGPLLGPDKVFDSDSLYIICANVIGSPYGTVSPLTVNAETGQPYGAAFPRATIRDTVSLHMRLLDELGVRGIRLATGGSMGGMQVLEWALLDERVQTIAPIAVGGRHSAWCIGWSEAQRQAIYADPGWQDGAYNEEAKPVRGLAAARMAAMISYRTRRSFEERFQRSTMPGSDLFAVESYLRYQGQKLVDRFDANCYVHLTWQMDSHDISRGRGEYRDVLASIKQPVLVIGIDTDGLYPLEEQMELAEVIPGAELAVVESIHGHDAFLIEFDSLNSILKPWMQAHANRTDRSKETLTRQA